MTGLYPEHHGLVANNFYDPAKQARYAINDSKAVTDGSWYSGTPLWSLAESQGMRTACFFWPGSEAKIAGFRPTYYLQFDNKIDDNARIEQVLAWLRLPPADRPHFITLYYDEPDHEGHEYGPDAPETKAAVREGGRAGRQTESGPRCDRFAHRPGCGERSRHGESAGRLDHPRRVRRPHRI